MSKSNNFIKKYINQINITDFNKRITFESASEKSDGLGGIKLEWNTIFSTLANMNRIAVTNKLKNNAVSTESHYIIIMRYTNLIKNLILKNKSKINYWRLRYELDIFKITDVEIIASENFNKYLITNTSMLI